MPALSNNRRELFAQLLVQGFTAVDAHENAGFKRNDGNASTLARHPEIEARVIEIKGELMASKGDQSQSMPLGTRVIAAKAKVTAQSLLDEAEEVRKGAYDNKQFSAANNAIKTKSVLSGHWIERAEVGTPGEFDSMTDEELMCSIVERFVELLMTDAKLERALAERLAQLGRSLPAIANGSIAMNGGNHD